MMKKMAFKIHILYKFIKGPWGGANQFLKALKKEFKSQGCYTENIERADIILFNSYPFNAEYFFNEIFQIKIKYPQKVIIHRLNSPIFLYRASDKKIDKIITLFNTLFADGIIFQSNWCREQGRKYLNIFSNYETVIHNASDKEIFNKNNKKEFNPKEKIKLITISWSSNWKKGFEIYKFLDENLDFSKYKMTFVGNSPIGFENIKYIKPIPSKELAEVLKQHDIYIFASELEACSNTLIEALSCGLPAVSINLGSNPEIVREKGQLFSGREDIIEKIEKVARDYCYYESQIPEFLIKKVAQDYYKFAERIYNDVQNGNYRSKQVSFLTRINFYKMKFMILIWKGLNKSRKIISKINT